MNRFMLDKWSWVEGAHGMRIGILDTMTNADLTFNPGGSNITFGQLFLELGEIEYSYISSLETLKQDWTYHNTEKNLVTNTTSLKEWFQKLDKHLKATISGFSDEDLKKFIDRSNGFTVPVELQVQIYLQAMFIFFGKALVYLKAMNKSLPPSVQEYI